MSNSPNMRRWGKVVRYFAYLTTALLVVVAAAAFFLPEFLDSPAVRSQIQRKLSHAVGGEVAWEKLELRVLPLPSGILSQVQMEIPGITHVRAERMEVRLQLRPLLRGHVEITDIHVARPEIRVDITSLLEGRNADDPFAAYRTAVQSVVDVVRRFAPNTVLKIEDGFVEVRAAEMLPVELRGLSIRLNTDSRGMDVVATMAGNYWERIQLSAQLNYSDLSGKASLDAGNIRPQAWLDRYLVKLPVRAALPAANLKIRADTDAKTVLNGDFELNAKTMEVQYDKTRVKVAGVATKGKITGGQQNSLGSDFELSADSVEVQYEKARVPVAGVAVQGRISANPQEIVLTLGDVQLDAGSLHGAKLRYDMETATLSGDAGFNIDLKQGMDYARPLVRGDAAAALARVKSVSGRMHGRAQLASQRTGWRVGVDIRKSDASIQLQDLADPVRIAGGVIDINARTVKAERISLSMAAGQALAAAHYSIANGTLAGSAGFDLDVARMLRMILGVLPAKDRETLAAIRSIDGRAKGSAKFSVARGTWRANVDVQNSNASIDIRDLPGPVRFAGGSIEIDPQIIKINRAALSIPGARGSVSATISEHLTDRLQVTASVAEGLVGEELLAWIWKVARIPQNLALKAPISIAAQRIAWSPKKSLDVSASAHFDAGPEVTVDGRWAPGALDIRRATIRDGHSDATVTLRTKGNLLEGSFSGDFYGSSIATTLRNAQTFTGNVAGDLHFVFDRDNPRRTTIKGGVKGESLDLGWLIGQPVKIASIDLQSDNQTLDIREAAVEWLDQRVRVRGQVSRSTKGPVIDLQLDSPGIDLDKLLPVKGETPAAKRHGQSPDATSEVSRLWPLPVTGRIAIRSGFVRHGRYTITPLAALTVLEERRVRLDLTQAKMCGLSLPLTIEASPQGVTAAARITAQSQQLDQTARCLTDSRVSIDGVFDLKADISTQGQIAELKQNLQGTLSGEMRGGKVMKFALLGNILSLGNVASLFKSGVPKLDDAGFPYHALTVKGQFEKGRFIVEEGAFRSDAVGLVGSGWISVLDHQSKLSVLVAPFSRIDEIMRKVPILGYILGGSLTSVPVGVSGDIRDPVVVPLGPGAVTSELMGIFERTLKLPGKLVTPFKDDGEPGTSPNGP